MSKCRYNAVLMLQSRLSRKENQRQHWVVGSKWDMLSGSACLGEGRKQGWGGTEVGLCLTTIPQMAQQIPQGALELGRSCITVPNQSLITRQQPLSGWRRPRGGVTGQDLGRGGPLE